MPVEAGITLSKPDSLAIVTNEVNSELNQGRHSDLVCDHRDLIKLKVPIGHGRRPKKRSHHTQCFGLRKGGMEEQIAAVLEIAEVQAQGSSIYNCRANRFLSVPAICQPYVASAAKAYAAIELINRFKFDVRSKLLCGDVNIPAGGRGDRTKGRVMG